MSVVGVGSSRNVVAVFVLCMALSGCSTVMRSPGADAASPAILHERQALVEAAAAVSQANWPSVDRENWSGRLFSGVTGSNSEDAAAKTYLAQLPGPDRKAAVMRDAAAHLQAVSDLAAAARDAAQALNPSDSDVAVVEAALGDVRVARNIYAQCLKALARAEHDEDATGIRALKRAFDQSMEELGRAADLLAARVDAERARSFAGPKLHQSS